MPVDRLSQEYTQDPRLLLCFYYSAACLSFPTASPTLPSTTRMTLLLPPSSKLHSFLWSHNTPLQWRFQLLMLTGRSQAPLNRPISRSWESECGLTIQLESTCHQRSNLTFFLEPSWDHSHFHPFAYKNVHLAPQRNS